MMINIVQDLEQSLQCYTSPATR